MSQQWQCADHPQASDHSALPRYAGSCLLGARSVAFDAFALQLGADGAWLAEAAMDLEGATTRLMYAAPPERSTLEVFRNYQQGL